MEQVHKIESMSNNHWVIDNEINYSSNYKSNSSEEVDILNKHILPNKTKSTNVYENENSINTDFDNDLVSIINVPLSHYRKRFDIIKRKIYTANNKTWKGQIIEVNYPYFVARLYDLDNHTGTYEEAVFNIKTDITEQDEELIDIGAIFYWSVGNVISNKTSTKRSEIRMRRIANITTAEFDTMRDKIESDFGNLTWGE